MVKLLYSALYTQPPPGSEPVVLTSSSELSSFGYFQRGRYEPTELGRAFDARHAAACATDAVSRPPRVLA
jgi:hypothetical protein